MNLKFRAWDLKNKKFNYDLFISNEGVFDIYQDYGGLFTSNLKVEHVSKNYIIQRFTGMKDSCGVEIYEGDIVKKFNYTSEVFWNDAIGGFDLNKYGDVFHFRDLPTMKVVGHINGI